MCTIVGQTAQNPCINMYLLCVYVVYEDWNSVRQSKSFLREIKRRAYKYYPLVRSYDCYFLISFYYFLLSLSHSALDLHIGLSYLHIGMQDVLLDVRIKQNELRALSAIGKNDLSASTHNSQITTKIIIVIIWCYQTCGELETLLYSRFRLLSCLDIIVQVLGIQ